MILNFFYLNGFGTIQVQIRRNILCHRAIQDGEEMELEVFFSKMWHHK